MPVPARTSIDAIVFNAIFLQSKLGKWGFASVSARIAAVHMRERERPGCSPTSQAGTHDCEGPG